MRFPGFSGEWEERKLKDIATFYSGGTPLTSKKEYFDGNISFIRSGEINSDKTEQFISELGLKNSSAKMVEVGDVLYALYGATSGEVGISKIKGAINQAVLCIKTDNEQYFLASYLRYKKEDITKTYLQGGQGNLSAEIIKNLKISFPSIQEQKKISDFLSSLDSKIQTQRKTIQNLESLMKGMSQKLFTQKIRFKEFTDEWKEVRLGKIGETFNGLTGKTKDDFGQGKPYIQYKQIFDSAKIQIQDCELVEISEKDNQNCVKYGDVFFTTSSETPNEIGMSSVLLDEVDEMYLNSFCFGYRTFSFDILTPLFASFFFRSSVFRNKIVKLAQGSTRYNMSKVELMKLSISLPSIQEQTKIADFLSKISDKIETEKKILELLEQQKKYFLQNLFI